MTNPWNLERLKDYLGEEESLQLDFKSSRELASGNKNEAKEFFKKLSSHVSAFLNSEGGVLLIGVEEEDRKNQPDIATGLSDGVPRKVMTAQQFENSICGRIHPSVAAYVHVYPITVGERDGDKLQAFAIEVKRGTTAYQAEDKIYYVRRGYSSDPMEDKDIRLRMLTDDRPRGTFVVTISSEAIREYASCLLAEYLQAREAFAKRYGTDQNAWPITSQDYLNLVAKHPKNWPAHNWDVRVNIAVRNVGNKTIREFYVEWGTYDLQGIELREKPSATEANHQIQLHFEANRERNGSNPIYPELDYVFGRFSVRGDLYNLAPDMTLVLRAKGYLDDGFSFAYEENIGKLLFDEFSRFAEFLDHIRNANELPPDPSH